MLLTPVWLALLGALWLGARALGIDLTSEALLGFAAGVGWEHYTRELWVYQYPRKWVVREVPVAVVAGWGFSVALASFIGQLLVPYGTWGLRSLLADGVASAAVLGAEEVLFGYVVHWWDYKIQKPWYMRVVSWVVAGLFLLTFLRGYSAIGDRILGIA